MFSTDDTIVAVATPPGRGALAIVRLSGPHASAIADGLAGRALHLTPRHVRRVTLRGVLVPDDAVVTLFRAPHSYTGQDVIEVSLHGGAVPVSSVVEHAVTLGARLAQPGEFTLRAFVHGKLDLLQAEAVHDVVAAVSPAAAQSALDHLGGSLSGPIHRLAARLRDLQTRLEASIDFPDEGYRFIDASDLERELAQLRCEIAALVAAGERGRIVHDGLRAVIVGAPNVGKSSVFNALVGAERAIVTEMPGTTRDLVSARVVIDRFQVELVDTAGLRTTADPIEAEGVRRARAAAAGADAVVVVVDRSRPLTDEERVAIAEWRARVTAVVVMNKCDLADAWSTEDRDALPGALRASSQTGEGLAAIAEQLVAIARGGDPVAGAPLVTNLRHRRLLEAAGGHVARAHDHVAGAGAAVAEEFIAADVQLALTALEELTGARTSEEVLHEIFGKFCIGK